MKAVPGKNPAEPIRTRIALEPDLSELQLLLGSCDFFIFFSEITQLLQLNHLLTAIFPAPQQHAIKWMYKVDEQRAILNLSLFDKVIENKW